MPHVCPGCGRWGLTMIGAQYDHPDYNLFYSTCTIVCRLVSYICTHVYRPEITKCTVE